MSGAVITIPPIITHEQTDISFVNGTSITFSNMDLAVCGSTVSPSTESVVQDVSSLTQKLKAETFQQVHLQVVI